MMHFLSIFTGPRYRPTIEWARNNWTHNVFRIFELIFGRKFGIRCEVVAYSNGDYTFFTWEARIAHFEGIIRKVIVTELKLIDSHFYSPSLRLQRGVIVYDTSGKQDAEGATATIALTLSGSNLTLVGYPYDTLGDLLTGVTWNTTETLTQVNKINGNIAAYDYIYRLFNPTTGTFNVVATTSSINVRLMAASYSGTNQTALDNSSSGSAVNTATYTPSTITTNVDNCMTAWFVENNSGNANTASTGTVRQSSGTGRSILDLLATSTGTYQITGLTGTGFGGGTDWWHLTISMAPAGGDATVDFLSLLNVG